MSETTKQFLFRHQCPVGETTKEFLARHKIGIHGKFTAHHNLKGALTRAGFVVKTIQRLEEHPIWELSLRPGTVENGRDPKTISRTVSLALRQLGYRYPSREVGVLVTGQVLKVAFLWPRGKPGIATFWSQN